MNIDINFEAQPVYTSDKRPWTQRCFICKKPVNFLKDPIGFKWLHVGELVRHKRCRPEPIK